MFKVSAQNTDQIIKMNHKIIAAEADKILKAADETVNQMSSMLDLSKSKARDLLFEALLKDPRFVNMAESLSKSNQNPSFSDEKKEEN